MENSTSFSIIENINWFSYNVISLIITSIGIIGNLLNLVVLTRPHLKGVMYVYLLGLAVSNLAVLITAIPALMNIGSKISGSKHYMKALYRAHFEIPLPNSCMASSVYIIISMTVNRYISIYKPTQFQRIHTFKNARKVILFSFLGGTILHIPLCFEKKVVLQCQDSTILNESNMKINTQECLWMVESNSIMKDHQLYRVYLYISETLLRFGPIITLAILNILIITRFQQIARKRRDLKGGPLVKRQSVIPSTYSNAQSCNATTTSINKNEEDKMSTVINNEQPVSKGFLRSSSRMLSRRKGLHNSEDRMLIIVLIAIVLLFVICTTPAGFLSIFFTETKNITIEMALFRSFANNLELLNFALNFYIYCLCSAEIRKAFVGTFESVLKVLKSTKCGNNEELEQSPNDVSTLGYNGNV